MLKLVAASTLVLSALAASIPFSHASQGCPENTKCGMEFASVRIMNEALLESALGAVRTLAMAQDLVRYGQTAQSPAALLVAARIIGDLNVSPLSGATNEFKSDADLLAEARALAADDAVILAMIDDVDAEQDRGSVFEIDAYDGQGGESWVGGGDSALFNRTYEDGTDAVLTLVAAPTANLLVRVVDSQGELVCDGTVVDGSHSCIWAAAGGADYAIQVINATDAETSFTIWTN